MRAGLVGRPRAKSMRYQPAFRPSKGQRLCQLVSCALAGPARHRRPASASKAAAKIRPQLTLVGKAMNGLTLAAQITGMDGSGTRLVLRRPPVAARRKVRAQDQLALEAARLE